MVVTFCGHVTNSFWMGIKMNIKKKKNTYCTGRSYVNLDIPGFLFQSQVGLELRMFDGNERRLQK